MNDKSIAVLREKRAFLASEYQEKLATFKPDYPDMRRLKAQVAQVDSEIERAATTIKGSLKAQYESLLQQEELLQKNIEKASGKCLCPAIKAFKCRSCSARPTARERFMTDCCSNTRTWALRCDRRKQRRSG